jgi:sugar phosphate isomerase/epimerase
MRTFINCIVAIAISSACATADDANVLNNQFFAFDNGIGRGNLSPEQQAKTLAELGYAGIGYTGTEDLADRMAAFKEHGVKVFNLYVPCYVDKSPPYGEDLVRAIERLKGTDVDLWLTVQGKAKDDTNAVQAVRTIADLAAASGLRVALYPHTGFFVADIDDALRITQQVGRKNVGVTFNLCHELQAGNEARFDDLLERAAPHLFLVSINGADHEGGWDKLIRPLGDGEFDVYSLLKKLHSIGYDQPIGLQCYAVKGDQIANLKKSLAQWNAYRALLAGEAAKK